MTRAKTPKGDPPPKRERRPRRRRLLVVPPDALSEAALDHARNAARGIFARLEAGAIVPDLPLLATFGRQDLIFAGQVAAELDQLVAGKLRERLRLVDQEKQQVLLCLGEGPAQARIDRDAEDEVVLASLRPGPLTYAEIDQRTKLGARLRAVLARLRRTKRARLLPHDRYALPESHG